MEGNGKSDRLLGSSIRMSAMSTCRVPRALFGDKRLSEAQAGTLGNVKIMLVPFPGELSAWIAPPWASTMQREM